MYNQKYRPRIIDSLIKKGLHTFGGVLLTGPKMCGKTWSAYNAAASSSLIDDEKNLEKAQIDPNLILEGEYPRLIDEWQLVPKLWDKARRIIDQKHRTGLFIFTGSAVPSKSPIHTGVGRFLHLKMRPMSLFESKDSNGKVSLSRLFAGKKIRPINSALDIHKIIYLICRGGWPSVLWTTKNNALEIPKGYLDAIIEFDIGRMEKKVNKQKLRILINSLARNSATLASNAVLLKDTKEHEQSTQISIDSIDKYLQMLRQIFIIEDQLAWAPSLRSKTRLRTSPKRHFIDPSLAVAALNASPKILLDDLKTVGFLFESLSYRDLKVYTELLGGNIFHYRDELGLEVDNILLLKNGNWAMVEVKLGDYDLDEIALKLKKIKNKIAPEIKSPSFMMILTATGKIAYTREDGIHVVPIDCLGP